MAPGKGESWVTAVTCRNTRLSDAKAIMIALSVYRTSNKIVPPLPIGTNAKAIIEIRTYVTVATSRSRRKTILDSVQQETISKSSPAWLVQFRIVTRALRHRNFRLFLSGQFLSLIGTWVQTVAQS